MKIVVVAVVENGCPLKRAAEQYAVKRTTLRRYVEKYRAAGGKEVKFTPHYNCRQIFTDDQEQMLAEYFTTAAKYHYGLSPSEARNLAMEFAMRNDVHVRENWLRDSSAGQEWMIGFMRRHAQPGFILARVVRY